MMAPPPLRFIPASTDWQVKNMGRWLIATRSFQ